MNVAEWGDGIFGIGAASRHYFGKGAGPLRAREAAALAVVLPNPRRYHPTGGVRYVESRTEAIYRIMVRRGIVLPESEQLQNERGGSEPLATQSATDAANPDVSEGAGGSTFPHDGRKLANLCNLMKEGDFWRGKSKHNFIGKYFYYNDIIWHIFFIQFITPFKERQILIFTGINI